MMRPSKPLANELEGVYNRLYSHFGTQHWWPVTTRGKSQNVQSFEIFLGAILTQQTAWTRVEKAIQKLKKAKMIDPKKLARAKPGKVSKLIKPVAFYPTKAKRMIELAGKWDEIKKLSAILVPDSREAILKLHGIGPETCDSILLYAFHRPTFVVDAYTKRFVRRYFGMQVYGGRKGYEETKLFFERSLGNLPDSEKIFNEYHALIVELGKNYCRTKPKCGGCVLNQGCMKMIR